MVDFKVKTVYRSYDVTDEGKQINLEELCGHYSDANLNTVLKELKDYCLDEGESVLFLVTEEVPVGYYRVSKSQPKPVVTMVKEEEVAAKPKGKKK